MKEIQEIANFLKEKDNFILATHLKHDLDALGSLFGIAYILNKLNKKFSIYFEEDINKKFAFLPFQEKIFKDVVRLDIENAVVVDCDRLSRVGDKLYSYIKKNSTYSALIDHHKTNQRDANINLVLNFNSTSEIIYLISKELQIDIDKNLATILILGILGDTLIFTIEATKEKMAHSLEVVKDLVLKEGDYQKIVSLIMNKNWSEFKKEVENLNRINFDGEIAWLEIKENEIEGIADKMNKIEDAKVVIVFKPLEDNKTKISLRSKGDIDVADLSEKFFNGGGHKNSAGGILNMDLESAKNFVLEKIKEYLKNVN